MSIVSLSTGEPSCTLEDLENITQACNFRIPKGSLNETEFLLFANSFDAVCQAVQDLPEYHEPRLKPCAVEDGKREYQKPERDANPLNAWSHRTSLKSAHPDAAAGLLAGRTIAVKDNVSVAGLPLTLGASPSFLKGGEHPISPIDATVIGRVLAAGGTIKGTATCENLSMFALSYTSNSGVVHNAWLPGYATGGSSSGCGALVSIGDVKEARENGQDARQYPLGEGVDLALGGDQGGSIRLPAAYSGRSIVYEIPRLGKVLTYSAFCVGIYGLKATHGLIPYTGIASLGSQIDHVGPMARTVEDIALLLSVLAGYDGIDCRMSPDSPMPSSVPKYLENLNAWINEKQERGEWDTQSAAKGLRVGILKESFEVAGLDEDVASSVRAAAERFKSLGAEVKDISIPLHKHGASIWTIAARPNMPCCVAGKPPDLLTYSMPHLDPVPVGQHYFDTLAKRNPAAVNVLMNAAHMEQKYGNGLARKAYMHVYELRAAYDKALEEVDVLLTPLNPTVGPKHPSGSIKTDENPGGLSERLMDLFEPAIGNTLNTAPYVKLMVGRFSEIASRTMLRSMTFCPRPTASRHLLTLLSP